MRTYPSCKVLFECLKLISDKLKHYCDCNRTPQAYLPFASLGGCAVGFLVCIQELLGPSKTLNAEVTKAAATLPTKAFCRRDTNLARVFKEAGHFPNCLPLHWQTVFLSICSKFCRVLVPKPALSARVRCFADSSLSGQGCVDQPVVTLFVTLHNRAGVVQMVQFYGSMRLCSLGVASSNCSLPSSC